MTLSILNWLASLLILIEMSGCGRCGPEQQISLPERSHRTGLPYCTFRRKGGGASVAHPPSLLGDRVVPRQGRMPLGLSSGPLTSFLAPPPNSTIPSSPTASTVSTHSNPNGPTVHGEGGSRVRSLSFSRDHRDQGLTLILILLMAQEIYEAAAVCQQLTHMNGRLSV